MVDFALQTSLIMQLVWFRNRREKSAKLRKHTHTHMHTHTHAHTHTHTHTHNDCRRNWVLVLGWKYWEKTCSQFGFKR